jgi:DNA-binding NarL/FixJ family response regulator
MNPIRLLIIEDNRILREGITAILGSQKDITIIAASGKSDHTIQKIHQLKPNVILLDMGLRSQNSLHVVELVSKEFPKAKIIVMDLAPAHADILQFVKAGAAGFVLKDASLTDFLSTIRSVAGGESVLPTLLAESLFTQIVDHALKRGEAHIKDATRMTRREREVIALIGDGMTNKEIGQRLHISTYTVKSHVHNIMEKIALHTRLELANYAYTDRTLKAVAGDISMISH